MFFPSPQLRLQHHFARVLGLLEARDTSALAREQREARAVHVKELARYALAGRFPSNRDFPDRPMPYFVDGDGTRCAMAQLIEKSGGRKIVERVAGKRNNAFVRELVDDGALVDWLERAGLFVEEAALIQPSYCSTYANECFCYLQDGGVLELLVETANGSTFDARVTAVHGRSTRQVGDLLSASVYTFTPEVGDALVATDNLYPMYRVSSDGQVDTSTCEANMFGQPPGTAPLGAVIDNLLGNCGAGLGSEWTTELGDCGSFTTTTGGATSSSSSSGGSTTSGGQGGQGGEGGGVEASDEGDGCRAAGTGRTFGGALFVPSVLLAAAIGLRTRRSRR